MARAEALAADPCVRQTLQVADNGPRRSRDWHNGRYCGVASLHTVSMAQIADAGLGRGGGLPRDQRFQAGLGLAVLSPFLTMALTVFAIPMIVGEPEMGVGWGVLHIAAFGIIEAAWIIPAALVCFALSRRRFALGLVVGGTLLLAANGLAWLVGLAIGAK